MVGVWLMGIYAPNEKAHAICVAKRMLSTWIPFVYLWSIHPNAPRSHNLIPCPMNWRRSDWLKMNFVSTAAKTKTHESEWIHLCHWANCKKLHLGGWKFRKLMGFELEAHFLFRTTPILCFSFRWVTYVKCLCSHNYSVSVKLPKQSKIWLGKCVSNLKLFLKPLLLHYSFHFLQNLWKVAAGMHVKNKANP